MCLHQLHGLSLQLRIQGARESPPRDSDAWFRDTFDDAIGLRRISDVPIGVLLSGGLDSSNVAASLAQQAGRGVASFTVRFAEREYDEGFQTYVVPALGPVIFEYSYVTAFEDKVITL